MSLKEQDIAECIRTLEALLEDPSRLAHESEETRNRLMIAAGRVSRPNRNEQRLFARAVRKKRNETRRQADESQLARSGIRQLRLAPIFITPSPQASLASQGGTVQIGEQNQNTLNAPPNAPPCRPSRNAAPELNRQRNCYICKTPCSQVHSFYDQMCSACGDFNFAKRSQTADLSGRVAVISGARVKIGYQAAILLLRAGARVIVTTRFARDAAARFARERDHENWAQRIQIYGLDLRHTPSVEAFAQHLSQSLDRLDFLLHNACQTVRRPVGFYTHLVEAEHAAPATLPSAAQALLLDYEAMRNGRPQTNGGAPGLAPISDAVGLFGAPALSQLALTAEDRQTGHQLFPQGQLDADLQQIDLREKNSWRLSLDQVATTELLEVQLVNAIAPYVLNARLRGLMQKDRTGDKHIVNVSAMEGQFYRRFKTDKHPHTNMAKAALNMMTRTSAPDYARQGIYMNSVDTGWITDEDAAPIAQRKQEDTGFHPPLDIVDGAARIVDPIFSGFNTGRHAWGQFLKDYRPTSW